MDSFVITNDTFLSVILLVLFLLLSFELLEYLGSRYFSSNGCEKYTVSSTFNSGKKSQAEVLDKDKRDCTPAAEDPILLTMDKGGFVSPEALKEMSAVFPSESFRTLSRFLIARRGNPAAAKSMLRSSLDWKRSNLGSIDDVRNALSSKALFAHSKAKNGTSIIYFRGALYDRSIASTTDYVKAAAHLIEQQFKDEVEQRKPSRITVLIHTAHVEGGVNAPADLGFIKEFVKVLSDNFPERLDQLIIYPFPWFGRAIWSVIKAFMDPRTAEKVILLPQGPDGEYHCPSQIEEYVDLNDIPTICGGKSLKSVQYP